MKSFTFELLSLLIVTSVLANSAFSSDAGYKSAVNPPANTMTAIWNQDPGDPSQYVIVTSEYIPDYSILVIACDDFQPTTSAEINRIRWYGGYWGGVPTPFTSAHVLFYNNSGSTPAQNPAYNETFGFADTNESLWASPGYYYTINSIPSFSVTAGTTYWVSVYVALNYPPYWGIYYSSAVWGNTIVQQSQAYFGDLNWHLNENHVDWAFQLLYIPEEVQSTSLGMLKALLR
jgi:hypothetical protein